MHNLRLTSVNSVQHNLEADAAICFDSLNDQFFVADTKGLSVVARNESKNKAPTTHLVTWQSAGVETEQIVSCDLVSVCVCVTTREGDVLLYNPDTSEVEVAGTVSDGILASRWSPDEELLVLVTLSYNVTLLNSEFLPVGEFSLNQESFGEASFVTVGWGKKETQFHGSAGKEAARAGNSEGLTSGVTAYDDGRPRISWRGDGQMLAISYVDGNTKARRLRIADRGGVLLCTSENTPYLEAPLDWKPNGSLITSSQRLANKYNVIFYEKNGLRHGEFTLPEKTDYFVREVAWNSDSSVLMVWQAPCGASASDGLCDYVQLWTVNNYSWYLKDEIALERVQKVLWYCDDALSLCVVQSGQMVFFQYSQSVDRSASNASKLALVSVINGNKLLMTPFKQSKIPPPLCAYEVHFPHQVQAVAFAPKHLCCDDGGEPVESALCVLHGSKLSLLVSTENTDNLDSHGCKVDYLLGRSPHFKVKFSLLKVIKQIDLGDVLDTSRLLNIVWTNSNRICGLRYNFAKDSHTIMTFNLFGEKLQVTEVPCGVVGRVLGAACLDESTYLQSTSGAVYQLNPEAGTLHPTTGLDGRNVVFPTPCPQMVACNLDGKVFLFGCNERGRLYVNNEQLFGNCSSFLLHDDHLLVTTVSHKLYVLPLKMKAIMTAIQNPEGAPGEASERSIERGAKLVTAVPGDCEVVLQMPRGNIEMICPRSLMVHLLQRLLDSRHYHRCVEIMRKHRIDMNLVYDHDPKAFLDNCLEFVHSVESPVWIDLFIAGLRNEDTTETLYSFNYKDVQRTPMVGASQVSKVDTICTAIREAMIKADEKQYLLPILTSYVKMDSSQMDEALKKLQKMRQNSGSEVSCEEGLRHLLYIADADALCDVALGTYDFDLVMMVFEKSQKDPKEFLPFLNKLRRMETNYMKYSINVYLKRYKEAFRCLSDTGSSHVDECLALIKREKLFSEGLECLSSNSTAHKAIALAYADYNFGRAQFHEAALLYERAQEYNRALEAHMQLCNWRKALIMAKKLKYSKEQMLDFYYSLTERLKEKEMYREAAMVYETYLHAEEEAVSCLAKAHLWDDAVSLSLEHERPDLIDTLVLPELVRQTQNIESEISTMSSSIVKSCSRLVTVRELKEKEYVNALEHQDDAHLDSDMYCDSSTVTGHSTRSASSGASGRTYRSAKNRKKLDRKKHSTKEGSTYEDLGLISEIHGLFVCADALAKPVSDILSTLFSFGKDEDAARLQDSLHNLYRLLESKQEVVWPSEVADSDEVLSGPHLSTAELVKSRLGAAREDSGGLTQRLLLRMKELEPHLRHPPRVTRPTNWALGFLQRNKKPAHKSKS